REAENRPWIAGAEGADDDVVNLRRVLEHDHVLTLAPDEAEIGERRRPVGEEPSLELRIHPGLGDDARAVPRPDLRFVRVDQLVERGGIDQSPLRQKGLQRSHAELDVRERRVVGMVWIVRAVPPVMPVLVAMFMLVWMLVIVPVPPAHACLRGGTT